jgi:hypothetical protein
LSNLGIWLRNIKQKTKNTNINKHDLSGCLKNGDYMPHVGTLRPRLVRRMTIPLRKGIVIPRNRRWWNRIAIPILLFGCNVGIEH